MAIVIFFCSAAGGRLASIIVAAGSASVVVVLLTLSLDVVTGAVVTCAFVALVDIVCCSVCTPLLFTGCARMVLLVGV